MGMVKKLKRSPVGRRIKKFLDINAKFYRAAGGEQRPAFYPIDETYPCLRVLDQNYAAIRKEMEGVLGQPDRIPRYHDIAPSELGISGTVDPERAWKVFMLRSCAAYPRPIRPGAL